MPQIESTPKMVEIIYKRMRENLQVVQSRLQRPLTLAEKILFGHLEDPAHQEIKAGEAYLRLRVDRVIMQDATAQMAILQFMQSGRPSVAVPTSIHCDHLIRAFEGSVTDTLRARTENKEVYDFLRTAASKYGMGFWGPGAGIIHQVVLENYAYPGGLLIGSDSHTPNMGGLGMIAIGVGGADAVDAMAGFAWEVLQPSLIGVRLTGQLKDWSAPKDIILKVAGLLTVKGGTNRIIEYFGPGAETLSATGKATITNMGAEIGATTSIFPFDHQGEMYLKATDRSELAELAKKYPDLLQSDPQVLQEPEKYYEQVIEIDLSKLEPLINGPFTPDLARPVSKLKDDAIEHQYPPKISAVMIGSCTNSSYEDLSRVAEIAKDAASKGMKVKTPLMITPGSALIYETIKRDGQLEALEAIGAQVMANACGPCIGQWERRDFKKGEKNTIVNSYNRNFPGRNDDNPETLAFVASPEVALAYAFAGDLTADPFEGLNVPPAVLALPTKGYVGKKEGYEAPSENPENIVLEVPKESERLQILDPFAPMVTTEFHQMPVLMKTKGKTTTDHISPAGSWLRYRGHLDKISNNMLLGATNAWTGERGLTSDIIDGRKSLTPAEVARHYKAENRRWIIVGDENYGEGSSREHAAMSPRWLGCAAVVAKSFARIHESNLKKQGILPLTFCDNADYDKIREGDLVNLEYLQELDPIRTINMLVEHTDGTHDIIKLKHNMTLEQQGWFYAGSALNLIRKQQGEQTCEYSCDYPEADDRDSKEDMAEIDRSSQLRS